MKLIFCLLFMMLVSKLNFWLVKNLLIILFMYFLFFYPFSFYSNLSLIFGLDFISYLLIMLSLWLGFLMIMSSEKIYKLKDFDSVFILFSLMLILFLILTFCSLNLFLFYLMFEASLIPIMLIILGWGYQPERIQAGIYLFFYTLIASMPMLLFIFNFYSNFFTLDYIFLNCNLNNLIYYFMMNLVFLVKLPMFMVHLWLPKAHVEAPVSGSMMLAGVMLKLGGYGLMRFLILFKEINNKLNFYLINLSLLGAILVSLICLRQSDSKSLIAYSSVVHMGLMLSGMLTLSTWGYIGTLIIMISHGLCSSGLFVLVNICYERLKSRSLYLIKGMLNIFPTLSLWWFLMLSSNMAAPPSLNLMGEIMLINSLVWFSFFLILFLVLVSIFSASYSLYLYSFSQHGKLNLAINMFKSINMREFLILFLHWVPLNLLFLNGVVMFS
uniref:NADH-ubiquinone oxidoreductase chain 4 n=1 Tax=Henosepilachna pusillanima TaxID=459481 RepID=W5TZE5_9CUCU|nr:NADH dehydrogenase subunit 4 [Henosepilachna pusillanima]AHH30002.1 NADH dehydrogenase subunit 4 [Henosepilachna pusillanima]